MRFNFEILLLVNCTQNENIFFKDNRISTSKLTKTTTYIENIGLNIKLPEDFHYRRKSTHKVKVLATKFYCQCHSKFDKICSIAMPYGYTIVL